MPSPFPGMDPFIESQCWKGFHHLFISEIQFSLTQKVRPRYGVDVEEEVYLARDGRPVRILVQDVAVRHGEGWQESNQGGLAIEAELHTVTLPMAEPIEIPYLVIRRRDNEQTIAVLEVSPMNKSAGEGRGQYLVKRNALLRSQAHLVELDLLRQGERLPTIEPHPPGDYFSLVSRVERRPQADVMAWTMDKRMPTIPIPQADGDPDVPLDLQAVFNSTYDRAGYDCALKYERPLDPSLDE